MAMMVWVHVWFRPFRDELSLRRDDGRGAQKWKGRFRRKNGETADVAPGRQRQYDEANLELESGSSAARPHHGVQIERGFAAR
jgi:hypothetical protein